MVEEEREDYKRCKVYRSIDWNLVSILKHLLFCALLNLVLKILIEHILIRFIFQVFEKLYENNSVYLYCI